VKELVIASGSLKDGDDKGGAAIAVQPTSDIFCSRITAYFENCCCAISNIRAAVLYSVPRGLKWRSR